MNRDLMLSLACRGTTGEKPKWAGLEEWYLDEVIEQTWADSLGLGINAKEDGNNG